ncbi:MAG: four-carbon acid sugar kinase family protein [Bifidobacteriaceae bacterium]|jgi:4-hydroxythreonine-4-phosphate dehydrogenase|nr:four-carbon acid sugar kinase family protein [Bifidobacteriaceae bacterium]
MDQSNVVALADDLSGAVEVAAALAGLGGPSPRAAQVLLHAWPAGEPARAPAAGDLAHPVTVADLSTRPMAPAAAVARLKSVLPRARALAGRDGRVFKKIDSMWRGNTLAEVNALAAAGPVVLAPALPAQRRPVVDGVLLGVSDGAPDPAGRTDLGALLGRSATVVGLGAVRGDGGMLDRAIAAALETGSIPLIDGASDQDLDRVALVLAHRPELTAIGTGGLAAAIGRQAVWPAALTAGAGTGQLLSLAARPLAVIVGSIEPAARRQLKALQAASRREPALARNLHIITSPTPRRHSPDSGGWTATLATRLLTQCPQADLVATGGATARAVLDALDVDTLYPLAEPQPGAVVSLAPDGRLVVTRPGSYGEPDSLITLVNCLRQLRKA